MITLFFDQDCNFLWQDNTYMEDSKIKDIVKQDNNIRCITTIKVDIETEDLDIYDFICERTEKSFNIEYFDDIVALNKYATAFFKAFTDNEVEIDILTRTEFLEEWNID